MIDLVQAQSGRWKQVRLRSGRDAAILMGLRCNNSWCRHSLSAAW